MRWPIRGGTVPPVFAADGSLFLGKDLLPWLLLAFGGAMVAGNLLALFRPPANMDKDMERPNPSRAWSMIAVGAVVAVWALATLLK